MSGVLDGRHRLTTAGLVTLVTFVAFEAMAVATVLPTAVAELDGLAWYGWPFTAFLVAQVVGMVLGGDLGDRRGPRVALLWGVGVFAAGLLASGLAADMALFVVGRAVQGLGGGFISVSIYVVAGAAFDARLRPALFGALSAAWVVPALVGPLLAGLLTSVATWRLVFLGILPLVAAGLALVLPALRGLALRGLAVPDGSAPVDRGRRWWALCSGVGVAALQYAGQRLDAVAVPVAVVGLVALVLGLGHLLPRGTARAARGLPTVVAARGLLAGAFFGVESLIPLSLSQLHGASPTAAGVPLTAGAVGWSLASALQGRRPDLSRVRLLQIGFGFVVVGVGGTALVAVGGLGEWSVYATWAVAGLGMGLGMSSVGVLLLEQSPEHRRGTDSASLQIADVTVAALCIGSVGVLVAASTGGLLPLSVAVLAGVLGCTAVGALGWAVSGRARVPAAPVGGGAPTLARS